MGQVRREVGLTIQLEDLNELSDEESQALEQDVRGIFETGAANGEAYAQAIVPVRTGNLLSSIFGQPDPDDLTLTLGATAEYASFVEGGTRKMAARPFIEPAAEQVQEETNLRIEQAILDRLDGRLDSSEQGDDVTMEVESETAVESLE